MRFSPRKFLVAGVVAAFFAFNADRALAADSSYDRYTSALRDAGPSANEGRNVLNHLLVYPFELMKWPLDQALVFIENYHMDRKAMWGYEKLQERGITPSLGVVALDSIGGGGKVDLIGLLNKKASFPDGIAKTWIDYETHTHFEVGSEIGMERIGGTGLRTLGSFKYENRPEEHFFGIGPNTSRGDGYVYKRETTALGASVGYSPEPVWGIDGKFLYQHVNIRGGRNGKMGQIGQGIFNQDLVPGLTGDNLITIGPEINYDTRNHKENSTRGGLYRAAFNYNTGVDGKAEFFKYVVELSRYLRLGSERRVLAAHFYGEYNEQTSGHTVPFHQMPRLGGFGAYPDLSSTLRGFEVNRFTDKATSLVNLEYRYAVWEHRNFKMDTILFCETGQVFDKLSNFKFVNFRFSYGGGFRLSLANVTLLGVEMGLGEEGANFYVRSQTPF